MNANLKDLQLFLGDLGMTWLGYNLAWLQVVEVLCWLSSNFDGYEFNQSCRSQ